MRRVQLSFAWCFAILALVPVWTIINIIRAPTYDYRVAQKPVLAAKVELIATFLVVCAPLVMAWWTVLRKEVSGQKWATAATIEIALIGFLFVFDRRQHLVSLGWILVAVGIAGLGVFRLLGVSNHRERIQPTSQLTAHAVPGDGTNFIVNKLIGIVGVIALFGLNHFWWHWAESHALPSIAPPWFWLQFACAILVVVVLHEGGHAIAGMALKMKVVGLTIGPLGWRIADGQWKFQWSLTGLKSMQGQIVVIPLNMDNFRRRKILQVLAGPFANIATGLLALAFLLNAPGNLWVGEWLMISILVDISLGIGVLNLVPFRIGPSGYSDGAKLYQLIRGGLWENYQRLLAMFNATMFTAIKPSDLDIEVIRAARNSVAFGVDQLLTHLMEYSYFLMRGELQEADVALQAAEGFCTETALDPPTQWCSVFVFGLALVRRDAAAARAWWTRMELKPDLEDNDDRWTSLGALLWSEKRFDEAEDAWKRADSWARALSESGYAAAERNAVNLLREALDESRP